MHMKKIIILIAILIILGLSLPISNLIIGPPGDVKLSQESDTKSFKKIAAILESNCVNCHTTKSQIPFYARFPIAKDIISKDIREGTDYMDMLAGFQDLEGEPVGEVVLAKIEYTTHRDLMPPKRYILMHWDSRLNQEEKDLLLNWIKETRAKSYATAGVPEEFQSSVLQPLPKEVSLNREKVKLGDRLYHDTRLSGDNTIACASCHDLTKGGTDQLKFSKGIGGAVGDINAPTVFNSGYQIRQFWDGRAADLEEQANGPVNNPIEMGSNWPQVTEKLSQDEEFVSAFTSVYPDGLESESIVNAIAEFERSLITPSNFDRYMYGIGSALSNGQREGYALFIEQGCAICHVGKILGGQSFEKMGRKVDYFLRRGKISKPDYGRFNFTENPKDRFKFKVPTLRNITVTAPYFHDGEVTQLKEAIRIMAEVQMGKDLSNREIGLIEEFLMALTGKYNGKSLR